MKLATGVKHISHCFSTIYPYQLEKKKVDIGKTTLVLQLGEV